MDENDLNELKYIFSYLVDSFSYEVERDKKSGEIENTTRQLENDKKAIDKMKKSMRENMDEFVVTYNDFKANEEKIMDYISSVTDQYYTKHSQDILSTISQLKHEMEKYIENGIKAMNQFFSLNPLTILNSSIEISAGKDAFDIRQYIQCSYGISYIFRLEPGLSQFMKNPYFSSLYTGIKIPVLIAGDGSVNYENLDSYKLSGAKLSENILDCSFYNETSGNTIDLKYKISGPDTEIVFTSNGEKAKITENYDFMSHMDVKIMDDALGKLAKEITGLTEKDRQLVSLRIDGEEILPTMSFEKVFFRIIKSDYIKSLVRELPENCENCENPDSISKELIRHRIHIIGKDEDYILSTLFG
ncbi:hypothetical protein [Ferroplasma acidiphilum]|jgi:hypothetical protein|uniref:hypothetical protein n=1 Tax=Ferroplasma acidiphilum TaxID=74969 RepID=UPI0023F1A9AE|nr:hypothetical protein [Ferroplasma acidiphilum]MCL4349150.1 hypothetical protein [Candidatus Thermoplasmatota archaeon]